MRGKERGIRTFSVRTCNAHKPRARVMLVQQCALPTTHLQLVDLSDATRPKQTCKGRGMQRYGTNVRAFAKHAQHASATRDHYRRWNRWADSRERPEKGGHTIRNLRERR